MRCPTCEALGAEGVDFIDVGHSGKMLAFFIPDFTANVAYMKPDQHCLCGLVYGCFRADFM